MSIGIAGYGVIGKGIHRLFCDDIVAIYDKFIDDFNEICVLSACDVVIICVPTPEGKDGMCDISAVWEVLDQLSRCDGDRLIIIKSTISPLSAIALKERYPQVVFSPEYMGESSYFTPEWKYPHPRKIETHSFQIFGGEKRYTNMAVDLFKRRMGVDTIFWQTDIVTASLCKYMENTFFATKVTFCNEFFDIAESLGVNYNELREIWLLDPRINRNHTHVYPQRRGFDGKCLPKDIAGLLYDVEKLGSEAPLLSQVKSINEKRNK